MSLSTVEDDIHLSDSDILLQQFYDIELVTRQILLTNAMVDGDDGDFGRSDGDVCRSRQKSTTR